jgi:hypothetical protein
LNVVYIIGAGASSALKKDGRKVPVLAGMLKEICISFPDAWKEVEWILNQLRIIWDERDGSFLASYGSNAGRPLDFELLMQALEELCASSDSADAKNMEVAYNRLIDLACRLFSKLDAEFVSKLSVEENIYRMLAQALRQHSRGSQKFISLNYDIWLEQALGDEGIWEPVGGYIENNTNPVEVWHKTSAWCETRLIPEREKNKTLVLKPHGSVSWFVPRANPYAPPLIWLERGALNGRYLKDGRIGYRASDQEYVLIDPNPRLSSGTHMPLVMPPTQHKGILGRFMARVYENMDRALQDASAVVVIGWSMPVTDLLMRLRLYDVMASRRENIPKWLIICDLNPTDIFYNRYAALLPAENMKRYPGGFNRKFVEEYLVPLWQDKLS